MCVLKGNLIWLRTSMLVLSRSIQEFQLFVTFSTLMEEMLVVIVQNNSVSPTPLLRLSKL